MPVGRDFLALGVGGFLGCFVAGSAPSTAPGTTTSGVAVVVGEAVAVVEVVVVDGLFFGAGCFEVDALLGEEFFEDGSLAPPFEGGTTAFVPPPPPTTVLDVTLTPASFDERFPPGAVADEDVVVCVVFLLEVEACLEGLGEVPLRGVDEPLEAAFVAEGNMLSVTTDNLLGPSGDAVDPWGGGGWPPLTVSVLSKVIVGPSPTGGLIVDVCGVVESGLARPEEECSSLVEALLRQWVPLPWAEEEEATPLSEVVVGTLTVPPVTTKLCLRLGFLETWILLPSKVSMPPVVKGLPAVG